MLGAMRSSLGFLTSSFAAETYGWEGSLQNSFGGAEQPRMIELLVYDVGGQLVLGPDILGGRVVLGPAVRGSFEGTLLWAVL